MVSTQRAQHLQGPSGETAELRARVVGAPWTWKSCTAARPWTSSGRGHAGRAYKALPAAAGGVWPEVTAQAPPLPASPAQRSPPPAEPPGPPVRQASAVRLSHAGLTEGGVPSGADEGALWPWGGPLCKTRWWWGELLQPGQGCSLALTFG